VSGASRIAIGLWDAAPRFRTISCYACVHTSHCRDWTRWWCFHFRTISSGLMRGASQQGIPEPYRNRSGGMRWAIGDEPKTICSSPVTGDMTGASSIWHVGLEAANVNSVIDGNPRVASRGGSSFQPSSRSHFGNDASGVHAMVRT
jgi:hypothetical protein